MTSPGLTPEEWLSRARSSLHQGEFLSAYDIAMRGSDEYPNNNLLKYQVVLEGTVGRSMYLVLAGEMQVLREKPAKNAAEKRSG